MSAKSLIDDQLVLQLSNGAHRVVAGHVDAVDAIRHMGRSGAAALRIAANLANGLPADHGLESQRASRALKYLQRSSIVHRSSQTGRWEIDDPLLATYIRNEIA